MPPPGAARANADHAPRSSQTKLSEHDRAELEKLDAAVGRLQKITRPDPYRISISQDEHLQYAHQYRSQQYQWLHNMPFSHREDEGIQYQTFVYQEPGQNILSLHAQHYSEERPGTADNTRNTTGSNTPAQGPKKRISLGAYKKKQAGETPTGEDVAASAKQPAVKGPAEKAKELEAESADMLKAAEEDEKADLGHSKGSMDESRKKAAGFKQSELKRKRDESGTTKDQTPKVNGHESPPPPKKAKTQPSTVPASKDANRHPSPQSTPAKRTSDLESQMPRKLSPLRDEPRSPDQFELPPRLSPGLDDFQMPPRLSSDLPPNIRKSLAAMDDARIVGRPLKQTSNRKKEESPPKEPSDAPGRVQKDIDPNDSPQASSKISRTVEKSQAKDPESDAAHDSHVQLEKSAEDRGEERKNSLIVKIKFKKARKEDVQRILRLPARPDKSIVSPPATPDEKRTRATPPSAEKATPKQIDRPDARRSGKGVAQKIGPISKHADETRPASAKRSRSELEEESFNAAGKSGKKTKTDDSTQGSSSKKRQADEAAHETTTISTSTARDSKRPPSSTAQPETPPSSNRDFQKSQSTGLLPRKDTNPKRDSRQTTDQASGRPRSSTNNAQPNGTSSKNAAPARSISSKEWEVEQRRLDSIGREIKHSATDLLKDDPNTAARETAAVKCLESFMCYLLAFSCSDRAATAADKKPVTGLWRSLPPFYSFVERHTASFPHLSGLASALAVVFHAHIFELVEKSPGQAPSSASLINLNSGLLKAAANTEEKLDIDTLMESFPKSWKGRTKASAALNDDDTAEPRRLLHGPYKLPMGLQTDPVQAARAGMAILKEWIAKEGLEYDFRIDA